MTELQQLRDAVLGTLEGLWGLIRMAWIGATGPRRWFENVMAWCVKTGRTRYIDDHLSPGDLYMTRHYPIGRLIRKSDGTVEQARSIPFLNPTIHLFHRGDNDGLHDHPWPWVTIILAGGYWETTKHGRFWRGPGTILFKSHLAFHRIELDPRHPYVVTMFIMGPKTKGPRKRGDWGFLVNRLGRLRWIPWTVHLGLETHTPDTNKAAKQAA